MLAYIIRRVAQSALVLLIVGLVAFAMFRFVGDPIDNMLGQERTAEDIERLRAQLGLDQPFVVQYYRFLENAVQGNFGVSYRQGRPVIDILMERAPATLELAAVSGILAIIFGIALGVFTAIKRNGICGQSHHVRLAHRGVIADVPDRDPADLSVFRRTRLAAEFRARRVCRS